MVKLKEKFTLQQVMKAKSKSTLSLTSALDGGWMVNAMPWLQDPVPI